MEICALRETSPYKRFISYLRNENCDVNIVKDMISQGADVNCRDSCFNTPLHIVLRHCRDKLNLVRELLTAGTHPNVYNVHESVALHFAVMYSDDVRVIRELITHGAVIHLRNREKNSMLHLAVKYNKKSFAELFIQSGIDINPRNTKGETPLIYAVKNDNLEIVKLLLSSGASVSIADQSVSSPLHVAVRCSEPNQNILIELMRYNADMYCMDSHFRFPLEYAVQKYYSDPSDELLSAKTLLKCAVLQNIEGIEMFSFFDLLEKYDKYSYLSAFNKKCIREAQQMKSEFIHKNFSLFTFAQEGFECKPLFQKRTLYRDFIINQILRASKNYPIYTDIIAYHLQKMELCLKLVEFGVYAWKECSEEKQKVLLTHDEIFILSRYLPNADMLNFVLAFCDLEHFAFNDFGFQNLALGKSSKRKLNESC